MSHNLALKLRTGTQQAHTNAENVGFMKCFLKGAIDRNCFTQFLSNLYFVYTELETAIAQHQQHPIISQIYFPQLNRQIALEKDMVFYYGSEWLKIIRPGTSALNYMTRIRQIAAREPVLLIGHAYTRYMGDLSGGQMLQKIAQTALNLSGYEGTYFYTFEQIPDKKNFKDGYRQALDSLPIDDRTADKIVVEANHAFHLNMLMGQELEASLIQALGATKYEELTGFHQPGSTVG
jgi:heme oxygenase